MTKYHFEVSGLSGKGTRFEGRCISTDIVKAIDMFRKEGYFPHAIRRGIMAMDEPEGIFELNNVVVND